MGMKREPVERARPYHEAKALQCAIPDSSRPRGIAMAAIGLSAAACDRLGRHCRRALHWAWPLLQFRLLSKPLDQGAGCTAEYAEFRLITAPRKYVQ